MPIEHLQPKGLFESEKFGFTQVVTSPPGKLVFVSGQVAWNEQLELVGGGDLGEQTAQALTNLGHALAAAGASPADVTQLRIYVANHKPEYIRVVGPRLSRFFEGGPPPAQTWIGVQSLGLPDFMIEIEAVAVVPE